MNAEGRGSGDGGVARALLISGLALAAAVTAFIQLTAPPKEASKESITDNEFALLCSDASQLRTLKWSEAGHDVVLTRSDRWRRRDGTPLEDRLIQVRLAQLRGLKAKGFEEGQGSTLEAMGLDAPKQLLEVEGPAGVCSLALGVRHPTQSLYSVQVKQGVNTRMGWAKVPLVEGALMNINTYRVRSVLPLARGHIERLEMMPQVGSQPFELTRFRGYFRVQNAAGEWRADEKILAQFFDRLAALKGELMKSPPTLRDADLKLRVHHPPHQTLLEFFVEDERVLCRLGSWVFVLDDHPMKDLSIQASDLRSLQVIEYERAHLIWVALHDGVGRVFHYRRAPAKVGVDQWFDGKRQVQQAHRLAALQWDLHTLRGKRRVDELKTLACEAGCRRVVVQDQAKKELVNLRMEQRDGAWFAQNQAGPVFEVDGQALARWPFGPLP